MSREGYKRQLAVLLIVFVETSLCHIVGLALDPKKAITQYVHDVRMGNLWAGTLGGVSRLKDGRFTHYTRKDGLSGNIVDVIYADRERTLWINTEDGGLSRFRDGRFTRSGVKDGLPHDQVSAIHEDREGNLWFGFPDGRLSQLKDGKVTVYGAPNGVSRIWVIYEDRKRNFWVATEDKLMLLKDGKLIDYPTPDTPFRVTSIYEDREGSLWMTTRGDGLIRIKDGESITYTTREGLPDNALTAVLEDGRRNLWLGSFRGIFSVSRRELDDFAHGKIRAVTPVTYGKADGLKGVECNSQQPSGWKSKDGRLWFPTVKGLVVVDPDHTKLNTLAPPVSNETGAAFDLYLLPHFYETTWFYALCSGLSAIALILLGIGWYHRRVNREQMRRDAYSRQLIAAQERDRKRIAADLHDGAGQLVNLMSHHALDGLGDPDNYDLVTGRFAKIASLAGEAIREMRLAAYNLRPPELDRLGLTRALEALVDRFNNSSPIEFTCELDQIDLALDDEHKVHLYRIVQESLNNIISHSQATEARLSIKREAKAVSIEIRDNGQGFEIGANGNRLGLGLPGITERARLLGGRAEIQSAPGQGAKIIILIILREVKS